MKAIVPSMLALVLAGALPARAVVPPSVYTVNSFDNSASLNSWTLWFGNASYSFDPTVDAGNNPNSGSLEVTANFSNTMNPQFGLGEFLGGSPWSTSVTVPAGLYPYLSMDVRWDPNSTRDGDGTFGTIIASAFDSTYSGNSFSFIPSLANANGWYHVVVPLPADPNSAVAGFMFRMYEGALSGSDSINGPVTFWLDNIQLTSVPEPGGLALILFGGFVARAVNRRRLHSH